MSDTNESDNESEDESTEELTPEEKIQEVQNDPGPSREVKGPPTRSPGNPGNGDGNNINPGRNSGKSTMDDLVEVRSEARMAHRDLKEQVTEVSERFKTLRRELEQIDTNELPEVTEDQLRKTLREVNSLAEIDSVLGSK